VLKPQEMYHSSEFQGHPRRYNINHIFEFHVSAFLAVVWSLCRSDIVHGPSPVRRCCLDSHLAVFCPGRNTRKDFVHPP
jgi:hypothetical protein